MQPRADLRNTGEHRRLSSTWAPAPAVVLALFAILAHLSCEQTEPDTTRVNIRLVGAPADGDAVKVSFSLDGQPDKRSPFLFNKPTVFFGIDFPEPGVRGGLAVNVEFLQAQCLIASGQGQLRLAGGQIANIEISLAPQTKSCPLTIRTNGEGSVKSEPVGIDCGQLCTFNFPFGEKVKLTALPGIPATPYLWGGKCSGGASCEVTMAGAAKVTVDFTPRVCTPAGFCWEHPRPQGADLYAVWVAPDQSVYAVGREGVILRGSGVMWSSLDNGTRQDLNAVWGSSSSDIWAVGYRTVLRWNGSRWDPVTVPVVDPQGFVGVWGTGPNDVWVVGRSGVILHFDGAVWAQDPYMLMGGSLSAIWGSGAKDVWIAGTRGITLHNTGAGWVKVDAQTTEDFTSLWGTGPGDVWAAGVAPRRWNGSQWVAAGVGLSAVALRGVWGTGANTVWGVAGGGQIYRWNGVQWSSASVSPSLRIFNAINGSGGTAWAVGQSGILSRLDSDQWTHVNSESGRSFNAAWMSAVDDGWAVGDGGSLYHWDGLSWEQTPSVQTTSNLLGIWGSGKDDVWAVGFGAILRFNGSEWINVPVPSGIDLASTRFTDVYGSGPNDVWIIGERIASPQLLHWDGVALSVGPSPPVVQTVYASASGVYVGGFATTAKGLHKLNGAGTGWDNVLDAAVWRVRGIGNELFVTARDGVHRWNGTAWSHDIQGESFTALHVSGSGDVWAYGGSAENIRNITLRLMRWNGAAWSEAERLPVVLSGITGVGSKDIWVVGEAGAALHLRQ